MELKIKSVAPVEIDSGSGELVQNRLNIERYVSLCGGERVGERGNFEL